ncbi:MAG TPA: ABC transporter permease [Burkholderiaceae bacterium]|jgi:peptide/nickel transport system permease protein|nr:ABC transporter permease [Burkholderiaceae bacterium]
MRESVSSLGTRAHRSDPVALGRSPWREAWAVFRRNRAALVGIALLSLVAAMLLGGPWLYPVDPFEIVGAPMTPPGPDALLGTDYLGRDVLAGVVHGGRPTVLVGVSAAMITALIGVSIGAVSGYYGRVTDRALGRVVEFFQVLPTLLFAMVLITLFSPTLLTVIVAIGVVAWPQIARLTRAEFLRLRQLDFVRSARAAGASDARIILSTILPNALPPIIVAATLATGSAILFEAGLSFLGLTDPNVMSWGLMIGSSRNHLREAWWSVTFPGFCIFLTVLAISLVGDGLNDAFNPKLRQR